MVVDGISEGQRRGISEDLASCLQRKDTVDRRMAGRSATNTFVGRGTASVQQGDREAPRPKGGDGVPKRKRLARLPKRSRPGGGVAQQSLRSSFSLSLSLSLFPNSSRRALCCLSL